MWSWGLSNDHARFNGLTAPTSPVVQQAMVNLFAEMGVQPDTLQTSLSYATQSSDTSPPVSTITSIAGGQPLTSDRIARITGTASDVGGGNVAAVEVSTDGGSTWSYATGTTNWSYSWIVPQQGNYTVMTRAIDDTAHLETPSDATTVSVVSSGLSSIFTQSPGDTIAYSSVSHNDDSGDPNSAELGVKFQVLKDGTISALRFYKAATDTGQHTVSLWSGNGTLLATATSTNETASGWQTVALGTPVTVIGRHQLCRKLPYERQLRPRHQLFRRRPEFRLPVDLRQRGRLPQRYRQRISEPGHFGGRELLGRRRVQPRRRAGTAAGRQQRQRLHDDREHRPPDRRVLAARQRHRPEQRSH